MGDGTIKEIKSTEPKNVLQFRREPSIKKQKACFHERAFDYDEHGSIFCRDCNQQVSPYHAMSKMGNAMSRFYDGCKRLKSEAVQMLERSGADRCPGCSRFYKSLAQHKKHCLNLNYHISYSLKPEPGYEPPTTTQPTDKE